MSEGEPIHSGKASTSAPLQLSDTSTTPAAASSLSTAPSSQEPQPSSPTVQRGAIHSAESFDHQKDTVPHSEAISSYFDIPGLPIISHTPHSRNPSAAGLSLHTDLATGKASDSSVHPRTIHRSPDDPQITAALDPTSAGSWSGIRRALSSTSMAGSLSPGSAFSSPSLNALVDLTPLPSPLMISEGSNSWRRASTSRPESQGSLPTAGEFLHAHSVSRSGSKKKYHGLMPAAVEAHSASVQAAQSKETGHSRNRSLSEYMPPQAHNMRPRNVTLSGNKPDRTESPEKPQLHREEYLATQRGLAPQSPKKTTTANLPTPPPSNRSTNETEEEEVKDDGTQIEYLPVRYGRLKQTKLFRPVRPLGQGTFSKVVLATSEKRPARDPMDELNLDPKQLVAIKIVQHGPAGGADEERVELSLKREVEMLQSVSHPSLIHLKAFDHHDSQALLVLTYCSGGDLFDLASSHRDLLGAGLVQRIFAELVSAVHYLHSQLIVHRDIKLENVLCNLPYDTLQAIPHPTQSQTPLVTLTDLGLSRRIAPPPESPLLTTRCGSEDYAAPEILLGQAYDGRQTDAWALGVLLYALMEGRLPFDPPPGKQSRGRGRTAHRVARCEWGWWRFGDDDGEWDDNKKEGEEWQGPRKVVEGLLKKVSRGRLSLEAVQEMEWVKGGIDVEGGLKPRAEDLDDIDEDDEDVPVVDDTMAAR